MANLRLEDGSLLLLEDGSNLLLEGTDTDVTGANSVPFVIRSQRSRRRQRVVPVYVAAAESAPVVNVVVLQRAHRVAFSRRLQTTPRVFQVATPQVFPAPKAFVSRFEFRKQWTPDRVYQVATPQVFPTPTAFVSRFDVRKQWTPDRVYQAATPQVFSVARSFRSEFKTRLQTVVPVYTDAAVAPVVDVLDAPKAFRIGFRTRLQQVAPLYVAAAVSVAAVEIVVAPKAYRIRFDTKRQDAPLLVYTARAVVEEAASKDEQRRYYRDELREQILAEDQVLLAIIEKYFAERRLRSMARIARGQMVL